MKFEDMKEGLRVRDELNRGVVRKVDPSDSSVFVEWVNGSCAWLYGLESLWPDNADPIKPAEPPADDAPLGAQPAGAVLIDGCDLDALRASNRELEGELRKAIARIAVLAGEAVEQACELGDLRGERDSLKAQVARLERALDDAQRRGRR